MGKIPIHHATTANFKEKRKNCLENDYFLGFGTGIVYLGPGAPPPSPRVSLVGREDGAELRFGFGLLLAMFIPPMCGMW